MSISISVSLAVAVLAAMSLSACSSRNTRSTTRLPTAEEEQLQELPPALKEAIAQQPEKERSAFLARPAAERMALAQEWQRREKMLDSFTPAERTLISSLSQVDSEEFFKIPADQKYQQERFLTDAVTVYLNSVNECFANTHRRFGPPAQPDLAEQSLTAFTLPERALIEYLTPCASKTVL